MKLNEIVNTDIIVTAQTPFGELLKLADKLTVTNIKKACLANQITGEQYNSMLNWKPRSFIQSNDAIRNEMQFGKQPGLIIPLVFSLLDKKTRKGAFKFTESAMKYSPLIIKFSKNLYLFRLRQSPDKQEFTPNNVFPILSFRVYGLGDLQDNTDNILNGKFSTDEVKSTNAPFYHGWVNFC